MSTGDRLMLALVLVLVPGLTKAWALEYWYHPTAGASAVAKGSPSRAAWSWQSAIEAIPVQLDVLDGGWPDESKYHGTAGNVLTWHGCELAAQVS